MQEKQTPGLILMPVSPRRSTLPRPGNTPMCTPLYQRNAMEVSVVAGEAPQWVVERSREKKGERSR